MLDANKVELELAQDLSRFINDVHNNRRIIIGCLNDTRVCIIFSRPRKQNQQPLLRISDGTTKPYSTEKLFKYIPLSMINATSISTSIRAALGQDFERLIVDVHSTKDKRSMISKDSYMHLIETANADEIRKAKLERKIFNNPKLWIFKLPNDC